VTTEFNLPILPLRNSVLLPASMVPINVGRARSVRLVESLIGSERSKIGVMTQVSEGTDDPVASDLHPIGCLARVVKVIRLGPANFSVILQGLGRFRLGEVTGNEPFMTATIERMTDEPVAGDELKVHADSLRQKLEELLQGPQAMPKELRNVLENVRDEFVLPDLIATNLTLDHFQVTQKQAVLAEFNLLARYKLVLQAVERQLEVGRVRARVTSLVVSEGKEQRELVLRQQMRTIKEELGENLDDDEVENLRERLREAGLPEDAKKIARKQLGRIASMPQQSAEYNVTRTYLEWLADLPWSKNTPDKLDLLDVRRCLEEDHFGLEKVKKRIVEYMAVRKLRSDKKGPILCFVGPPGVGKTSLGRSIARAMGRRYHRIALGGVRDEAEVRGHRRTYVGALPGRLMQGLKKVGVKNPVLVLDEIDKMGVDAHGDPSAALLEVLDPAQNDTFQDHYIDTPFDLSQVIFLATANNPEKIPGPLMDRMEVIEVSGYTRAEKRNIAREFVGPKQISSHGLTAEQLILTDEGIDAVVEGYTREAGVRGLEREFGSICRNIAMQVVSGESQADAVKKSLESQRASQSSEPNVPESTPPTSRTNGPLSMPPRPVQITLTKETVRSLLGVPRYVPDSAERKSQPGVATGLAWTPSGGDVLFIEATKMHGKGDVKVTGNLKSVMQESAHTALSFVRANSGKLGLEADFLKSIDLHLHVPKGGTPKDGPSAGITMFTAVASLLLGYPVKKEVAMTGEITLRGAVLPVGGIKEKLLAAHRAGVTDILLPSRNEKDLEDVPADVRASLNIHLVSRVDEVLPLVLGAKLKDAEAEL
jgi:ATP-dependent Lon protease